MLLSMVCLLVLLSSRTLSAMVDIGGRSVRKGMGT